MISVKIEDPHKEAFVKVCSRYVQYILTHKYLRVNLRRRFRLAPGEFPV